MFLNRSRWRITVRPVFVSPSTRRTFATSTPPAAKRSTAISPSESSPMRETNPTRQPSAARLCATIADELPRVNIIRCARSSRSSGKSAGSPYRIKSRFSSPAIVTSNRDMFRFFRRILVFEYDDTAQVPWLVRVQSLLDARVQAHQLPGEHVNGGSRHFRPVDSQL